MNEVFILYSLIYILVCSCFIFKTNEFVSAGITVEYLFQKHLGKESDNFVLYHIKKICTSILVHFSIPLGYIVGLHIFRIQDVFLSLVGITVWKYLLICSVLLPLCTVAHVVYWSFHNWKHHPVIQKLFVFCDSDTSWTTIAKDITSEFRQFDKIVIHCGSREKIIITRNWILKVGPYNIDFAHQDDTEFRICSAETYDFASSNSVYSISSAITQYLTVKITCNRNRKPFFISFNALQYNDMKDVLRCRVVIEENVVFYQTKVEQFLEIFRKHVNDNPQYYESKDNLDPCAGCMTVLSNVKLFKCCGEDAIEDAEMPVMTENCTSCKCKPMWCIDCMGRWFASRQNQRQTDTWLSSKCRCPVCRTVFCILDICPVNTMDPTSAHITNSSTND